MVSQMIPRAFKENIKAVRYWPIEKGIRRDRRKMVLFDEVIQNVWQNLTKSSGTSSLKIAQSGRLWPCLQLYLTFISNPALFAAYRQGSVDRMAAIRKWIMALAVVKGVGCVYSLTWKLSYCWTSWSPKFDQQALLLDCWRFQERYMLYCLTHQVNNLSHLIISTLFCCVL